MSAERDETRIVRSWLDEGVTVLPDRVLDAVLDQLPATPQRRARWLARRFPPMNTTLRIALATAAVVIVAILGIRFLGIPNNIGTPSETATPTPNQLPAGGGPLDAGFYVMSDSRWTPVPFTFTVPAGWTLSNDGFISKHADEPGELAFTAWDVTHVFAHACTRPDGDAADLVEVGPTVEDLASALAGQEERVTSGPNDATIGGYQARLVEFTAPTAAEMAECGNEFMRIWPDAGGDINGGWRSEVDQTDQVYVVGVGDKRVVFDTYEFPGTSEADLTELQSILDSIQF